MRGGRSGRESSLAVTQQDRTAQGPAQEPCGSQIWGLGSSRGVEGGLPHLSQVQPGGFPAAEARAAVFPSPLPIGVFPSGTTLNTPFLGSLLALVGEVPQVGLQHRLHEGVAERKNCLKVSHLDPASGFDESRRDL